MHAYTVHKMYLINNVTSCLKRVINNDNLVLLPRGKSPGSTQIGQLPRLLLVLDAANVHCYIFLFDPQFSFLYTFYKTNHLAADNILKGHSHNVIIIICECTTVQ